MRVVPEKRRKVQEGFKFGRWTVIGVPFYARTGKSLSLRQMCVCERDDGVIALVNACDAHETARIRRVWQSMLRRCENTRDSFYHRYGGRGIRVCEEWHDFRVFYDWAIASGYDEGLSIDRRDNDGPYCPENARWADSKTQSRNKSTNVFCEAFGETKSIADWAEDHRCKVNYRTLRARISDYGWSIEEAVATPEIEATLHSAFGEQKTLMEWIEDPRCVIKKRLVLTKRIAMRGWPVEMALTVPHGTRMYRKKGKEAAHGNSDRTA